MRRVIVIGASGNLGTRLVCRGLAHGHRVTAFVRDPAKLKRRLGPEVCSRLSIITGDATDRATLIQSIRGHDALVSAAGHIKDGPRFSQIFDSILGAALEALGPDKRLWFLGGAAALSMGGRKPEGLFVRLSPFTRHIEHLRRLEQSNANWSFACPGPMRAALMPLGLDNLVVSSEELPYGGTSWTRYAPQPLRLIYWLARVPWLIVPYEDVAELIMANLGPDDPFRRRRVGWGRRFLSSPPSMDLRDVAPHE